MTNQEPRQPSPRVKLTAKGTWRRNRRSKTKQELELYSAAYRLAWEQVPAFHRRERPDIPLRIHSSIRSQVKAGAENPHRIAFAALKELHERSDPNSHYPQHEIPLNFPRNTTERNACEFPAKLRRK